MCIGDHAILPIVRRGKTPSSARAKTPSLAEIRPVILRLTKRYGVTNVRIFGSFARGEQRKSSDVDLLIDPPLGMTLLDLAGLKIDLEDALHRKVDVIPDDSVKPLLRDRIFTEARYL